jgi:hypothetical protein
MIKGMSNYEVIEYIKNGHIHNMPINCPDEM